MYGAIIRNTTSLDTSHCKMYSRPNIELGVCKVCRDADELTFLPPAVMSQCEVIQLYVIQLCKLPPTEASHFSLESCLFAFAEKCKFAFAVWICWQMQLCPDISQQIKPLMTMCSFSAPDEKSKLGI